MLAVSHLNFKGWSIWVMVLCWFSSIFMSDNVVSKVIGNAGDHEATFILYTEARFTNVTTGLLDHC
jgi:uncharacterized membrane protein YiaA